MARPRKAAADQTSKVQLSSAIKSARDIMRKDAGLNGDLDRIPQLAWLLFLKAFDDLEQKREITDRDFRAAISSPYRWRDWATETDDGKTGEALIRFVNDDLLPHLRSLRGTGEHDPRDVLAAVFKETHNRMLSGYLLRDVVDLVNRINFSSTDDIHTMAHVYESMLREVRDAAGDSGEFYTPRPVIRFIVEQVGLKLGDKIMDPACGTGGFLVEALEHLRPQADNVQKWRRLQQNLIGIEKKPMPYLLGTMNMLLHGVEQPNIRRGNALETPLTQIPTSAKVDVVVTNPPFGGEEEAGIPQNFPTATRTAETALLFLQFVQRSLRSGGRCGMVVPNGFLFGEGVAARVKQKLLEECNLHTVVRLQPGAFAPYTDIPTNLLFFEKTGRTKEVWFYEIPTPENRKKYSKTRPMRFEEFADCQAWWGGPEREGRVENERSWRVPIDEIARDERYDLDRKNPRGPDDLSHRPPGELIRDIRAADSEIGCLLTEIGEHELQAKGAFPVVPLSQILTPRSDAVGLSPEQEYRTVGIYSFGRGLFERPRIRGGDTSYTRYFRLHDEQFVYSRLFAWEGAVAVVTPEFDGLFVSPEFPTFDIDKDQADPGYVAMICRWPEFHTRVSGGRRELGLRRQRVHPDQLLAVEIPLPSPEEQREIARLVSRAIAVRQLHEAQRARVEALDASLLNQSLGSGRP